MGACVILITLATDQTGRILGTSSAEEELAYGLSRESMSNYQEIDETGLTKTRSPASRNSTAGRIEDLQGLFLFSLVKISTENSGPTASRPKAVGRSNLRTCVSS